MWPPLRSETPRLITGALVCTGEPRPWRVRRPASGEEIHRQLGRLLEGAEADARAEGLAQEAARLHALAMVERDLPAALRAQNPVTVAENTMALIDNTAALKAEGS